jgi:RimJ/RimL family protein N-acetyltransferase
METLLMTQAAPIIVKRVFPWTDKSGERSVTFRLMGPSDKDPIMDLAARQTERDRAFLRTDLTSPAVVDEWIVNLGRGRLVTVLAEVDGHVVGYGNLHHDETLWTNHMGEIRVLVDRETRGQGIAKRLIAELFHIAREMKLERVYCQIPADQARVRNLFEELGFQSEAILQRWLMSREGKLYDLLIMTHSMDDFGAR